jgi:hypothetical protein
MYKILVTTTRKAYGYGLTIHTLVIDFDTIEEASIAARRIEDDVKNETPYDRTVVRLW